MTIKQKVSSQKQGMETLLVSFSVFSPPPTRAMLYHSSWLQPLGPGPDLRGPGGFWRGCPPGPGHECHRGSAERKGLIYCQKLLRTTETQKKPVQTKEEEGRSSNITSLPIIHQPSICNILHHSIHRRCQHPPFVSTDAMHVV